MPGDPAVRPGKIRTEGINFVESAAGVVRGNGSKNTSLIGPWATREMEENMGRKKSEAEKRTSQL